MRNIEILLQTQEAKDVLRRHHVTAKGVQAIRQGHAQKGDLFMHDLLKAVSPKSSVLRGDFGTPEEYGMNENWWESTGDPYSDNSGDGSKRSIEDWIKIAGSIGNTIGGIKQNVFGKVTDPSTPDANEKPDSKNNTILWVIVAVLVVGLGVLTYQSFKK